MLDQKSIEYMEYVSGQEPEFIKDPDKFKQAQVNAYESKVKPNLPMIAHLSSKNRTHKQIALALGLSEPMYKKIRQRYPIVKDCILWGKEVVGDKLELKLYEKAMQDGHFKSIEMIIEKLNSRYSKNQNDIVASLGFDKLTLDIKSMKKTDSELVESFDTDYIERQNLHIEDNGDK